MAALHADSGASRTSEDLLKVAQHHYNPVRDVVTRNEFIPERQLKVLVTAGTSCCCSQSSSW